MKTTELLRTLISEALYKSAFEELYKTYVEPKELGFDTLKQLIMIDPFTRYRGEPQEILKMKPKEFEETVKIGKYSKWLVKTYVKGLLQVAKEKMGDTGSESDIQSEYKEYQRLFIEDTERLKTLLAKFDKYKSFIADQNKKDIMRIKSMEELATIPVFASDEGDVVDLESYRGRQKAKPTGGGKTGGDVQSKFVYPGSQILKVGNYYTLIKIDGKGALQGKAASYFGGYHNADRGETNWCTSPEGSNACQNYLSDGPLYIFMANDDKGNVGELTGLPQERFQFHFPSNQFKDRTNRSIDVVEFLKGNAADLGDIFKSEFAKGLTTQGSKKLVIESFGRGGIGTYVALYGLDDLFETLPDDLEDISISQSGNQPYMIRIPDSITRFQRLNSLILENSISELNPNVCQLTNLTALGLEENKGLTNIPSCVWDMNSLMILNVKGSNVAIDESNLPGSWTTLEPKVYFLPEALEL